MTDKITIRKYATRIAKGYCAAGIDNWRDEISTIEAELRALVEEETAAMKRDYDKEVDEFNAGFEAFEEGEGLDDEPIGNNHDIWRVGWAWAHFTKYGPNSLEASLVRLAGIPREHQHWYCDQDQSGGQVLALCCDLVHGEEVSPSEAVAAVKEIV